MQTPYKTEKYEVSVPSGAPLKNGDIGPMGAGGAAALAELYGESWKGNARGDWDDRFDALGFQIAVWEIVYEYALAGNAGGPVSLDLDGGQFVLNESPGDAKDREPSREGLASTALQPVIDHRPHQH